MRPLEMEDVCSPVLTHKLVGPQINLLFYIVLVVESLLNVSAAVSFSSLSQICLTKYNQANPKLAELKDDDGRLPIHWAVSSGHFDISVALTASKNFDPDCQVRITQNIFFKHKSIY